MLGGGGLAEEAAEVEEVLVGGGALGEIDAGPLCDEGLGGDGERVHASGDCRGFEVGCRIGGAREVGR